MSEFDKTGNSRIVNNAKRSVVKRLAILGAILAVTLSLSIWLVPSRILNLFSKLAGEYCGIPCYRNSSQYRVSTGDYGPAIRSDSQLIEEPHKDSRSNRGCCHSVIISKPKCCSSGINRHLIGTRNRFCFAKSFGKYDSRHVFVTN